MQESPQPRPRMSPANTSFFPERVGFFPCLKYSFYSWDQVCRSAFWKGGWWDGRYPHCWRRANGPDKLLSHRCGQRRGSPNLSQRISPPPVPQIVRVPSCLSHERRLRTLCSAWTREEAFRVVDTQQIVMEVDGVHRPGTHEQDCHLPGVHHLSTVRSSFTQKCWSA